MYHLIYLFVIQCIAFMYLNQNTKKNVGSVISTVVKEFWMGEGDRQAGRWQWKHVVRPTAECCVSLMGTQSKNAHARLHAEARRAAYCHPIQLLHKTRVDAAAAAAVRTLHREVLPTRRNCFQSEHARDAPGARTRFLRVNIYIFLQLQRALVCVITPYPH